MEHHYVERVERCSACLGSGHSAALRFILTNEGAEAIKLPCYPCHGTGWRTVRTSLKPLIGRT